MRILPSGLSDRVAGGAAMLCHVWIARRGDGARFGFTDHDRDLEVDGVVCRAGTGWAAGAAEKAEGTAPGQASASGVLDAETISEGDVAAGLWDGAEVSLWRVDWSEPALRVRLWVGRLSRITRAGEVFTAEVEGPLAKLERVVGRTYGRLCDAHLGDGRCGVDLGAWPEGTVCDRSFRTCRERFGNATRFRGFPDIPGDDFLTAVPAEGGRHDGGSRR